MPLVRCRVREWRDVRTTRISHVVTDSTRRTNIEYSIRNHGEELGKGRWAVRRWASDAGRWMWWVSRKTLHVSPRSRGRTARCLRSFDPAPAC
jgi:hypothetical protein